MRLLTLSLLLLLPSLTLADIGISGFGTVRGGYYSVEGNANPYPFIHESGQFTVADETRFGLRLDMDLNDKFIATGQLLFEAKKDYDPTIQWGYLGYKVTDTVMIKAGRLINPIFYRSETEKVGYSHYYERLPTSVYLQFDFNTIDGISLYSRNRIFDEYEVTNQLVYGSWNGDVYLSGPGKKVSMPLRNIISYGLTVNKDNFTVFAGALAAEIYDSEFDNQILYPLAQPAIDFAVANGASEEDVKDFKDRVGWEGNYGIYVYGGFSYDSRTWLVESEILTYGIEDSSDIFNINYYFTVGYHFGDVTPLIYYESINQNGYDSDLGDISNPILKSTALSLEDGLAVREGSGIGLSVRWDIYPGVALKGQYYHGEDTTPNVGDIRYVSAGVDFVF